MNKTTAGSGTRFLLALAVVALSASLCSCTSTPIPLPPPEDDLVLSKVEVPDEQPATTGSLKFEGLPGSAPPNSTLRVTNLDSTDPPWSISVEDDGSFQATIGAGFIDELRFQIRIGDERREPVDVVIADGGFVEVERVSCFSIDKELDLGTGPAMTQLASALTLSNECGGDASLGPINLRTNDPLFAIDMPPTTLASGDSLTYGASATPTAPGEVEEILFINVDVDGQASRYPVTLFAVGQ